MLVDSIFSFNLQIFFDTNFVFTCEASGLVRLRIFS